MAKQSRWSSSGRSRNARYQTCGHGEVLLSHIAVAENGGPTSTRAWCPTGYATSAFKALSSAAAHMMWPLSPPTLMNVQPAAAHLSAYSTLRPQYRRLAVLLAGLEHLHNSLIALRGVPLEPE